MKPCLPLLLRALLLSACGAIAVTAGTFTVFGPEDITANQVPATRTFAVTNPSANWMIRIDNGGRNGQYQKISSGSIEVNGIEVAGNSDFNQNVMLIQGAVSLQANNTLVVDFNGGSSRGLTVEVFLVDETPPTITSMVAPPPNAAGWNNTGVTVSFNCQDTDTGITFCTDPVTIGALGTTNVLGLAQDGVFNTAETSVAVSIDTLDPISTTVLNPGPNEAGWNNTDVTVTFQAQDAISGIASVTPPVVVTVEGAAQLVNGSATDVAGNTANASASVSLDKTLPQLAIADPPDGTTVLVSVLQISGTVSDALSGLASVQCDGEDAQLVSAGDFTCDVSLEPDGNAIDVVAVDAAGNTATQTLNITFAAPPALTIYSPLNFTTVAAGPATITGTASPDTSQVLINGVPATLSGGGFSAVVPLHTGSNTIVATGSNAAGNSGMATVHVTLDDGAPFVSIDSLLDGAIVSSTTIVVGGQVGDPVGPTDGSNNVTVSVNGVAATVGGGRYVAEGVALSPGLNTLAAQAFDGVGNTSTFSISVNFQDPTGSPRITTVSGDMQQATIGEALADPLVAAVFNALGSPVANVPVVFRITRGSGTLVDNGTPARMVTVLTNAEGQASASLTLGTRAGQGSNAVEATAAGYQGKAAFVAAGLPDLSHHLHHDDGDNQVGIVGQPLPFPLVVAATDSGHNRLPNVPITFTVQSGGGNFGGQPSVTVMTDPEGFARATFTLGPTPGISDHVVTADTIGNAGSVITFSASAKVSGDPADTSVSGVVLDNTNIPVPGVTVSIDGTALTTQTTAQGRFFLQPAPVGAFHLHVDGTTATRPGAWASLAFEMVTIPGVDNDLGMPIHILPIDTPNSVYVSPTEGGTVTLAAIPGFSLEVLPGSATFPGGGNEGDISVTVVHADKVPMTPNFGQQPRLIITVQPPGVIFDPPAKVTYPNLDGELPGQTVELYSFDHDMERFVSTGTGTVSEDGLTVVSDQGVGITKTGWQCSGNPPPSGQCVNVNVTTSQPALDMFVGQEVQLTARGNTGPGTPAYVWTSSDSAVTDVSFAQGNDSQTHPNTVVVTALKETLDDPVGIGVTFTSDQSDQNGAPLTASTSVPQEARCPIESVTWSPLEGNELGSNPADLGEGKQIFPGKRDPDDAAPRNLVNVEVKASGVSGVTIYLKSFDMDDPTSDDAPIDPLGAAGDDNRSDPKSGTLGAASGQTDAAGMFLTTFQVTMQPGNNFRIAATCDEGYLGELVVDVLDIRDSNGLAIEESGRGAASELLTVWRTLHIEVDSMGVVGDGNTLSGVITEFGEPGTGVSPRLTVNQNLDDGSPNTDATTGVTGAGRFSPGTLEVGTKRFGTNTNGEFSLVLNPVGGNFVLPFSASNGTASAAGNVLALAVSPNGTSTEVTIDQELSQVFVEGQFSIPDGSISGAPIVSIAPTVTGSIVELGGTFAPAFKLFDDDGFRNLADIPAPAVAHLVDAFRRSFIKPVALSTPDPQNPIPPDNPNTETPWSRNLDSGIPSQSRDSTDANEPAFWVIYLQGIHEVFAARDADPTSEQPVAGVAFGGRIDTLIAMEVVLNDLKAAGSVDSIVTHEIGHVLGAIHEDGGVMTATSATGPFSTDSVARFRGLPVPAGPPDNPPE